MEKTCSRCRLAKPAGAFYPTSRNRDGLQSRCKLCTNEAARASAQLLSAPERRNRRLKTVYGLTARDYELLLALQGGACAICRSVEDKLQVAHDHVTGAVRGLLCARCNTTLGQARDDPEWLQNAFGQLSLE